MNKDNITIILNGERTTTMPAVPGLEFTYTYQLEVSLRKWIAGDEDESGLENPGIEKWRMDDGHVEEILSYTMLGKTHKAEKSPNQSAWEFKLTHFKELTGFVLGDLAEEHYNCNVAPEWHKLVAEHVADLITAKMPPQPVTEQAYLSARAEALEILGMKQNAVNNLIADLFTEITDFQPDCLEDEMSIIYGIAQLQKYLMHHTLQGIISNK